MLQAYEKDYDPDEYADFEPLEDRDELGDLELGDTPCADCGSGIKPRGAFGYVVVVECSGCSKLWTFELEHEPDFDDPDYWDYEDENED